VPISTPKPIVLVLTSDYLYQLDIATGNLTDLKNEPQYQNLTVAPNGDFILADYYNFEKVKTLIEQIESPIQMDMIELRK
jgi:hypothetical protein